jgi:hypothetical protein
VCFDQRQCPPEVADPQGLPGFVEQADEPLGNLGDGVELLAH